MKVVRTQSMCLHIQIQSSHHTFPYNLLREYIYMFGQFEEEQCVRFDYRAEAIEEYADTSMNKLAYMF